MIKLPSVIFLAKIIFEKNGGIDWHIKRCECSTVKKACYGDECDYDKKVKALILAESIYKKIKEK